MMYTANEQNKNTMPDFDELHQLLENAAKNLGAQKGLGNLAGFIRLWERALRNTYTRFGTVNYAAESAKCQGQIFCKEINFENFVINLCFDINLLHKSESKGIKRSLSLSHILGDNSRIGYNMQPSVALEFDTNPIYIVPFRVPETDYLVVDGNHRLFFANANHVDLINTLYFEFPVARESVRNPFEEAFYCLQNEFHGLYNMPDSTAIPLPYSLANRFV